MKGTDSQNATNPRLPGPAKSSSILGKHTGLTFNGLSSNRLFMSSSRYCVPVVIKNNGGKPEAMYFNSKKDQNQHHLTISVNIDEPGPHISFLWFACANTALNGVWDYKTRISLEEIDYWLSKTIGRGE
ncbi:hypothetical protein P5673_009049 [Acropora cervicornis]|uniref:Uncharacterized protein n=1 Tax=Acropora cervicornis TaxID=6130 RepID=A0AAD9QTT0_ACRCE|nr:hypothetical protein P5673_009049 [Acropora cervicornis]